MDLKQALATVRTAGFRIIRPKARRPRKTKTSAGPVFVAAFSDGQITRMSIFTSLETLGRSRACVLRHT
jgi:hypothetical protein